jgi:uncharacterized protein YneF (UPF0154 family)
MINMTLPAKPIKGPGLTAPGIVILQTIFILLIETFEYAIGKIGAITGLALLIAICGGIYLGRKGSEYVNAVNPPLAFLFSTILVLCTLGGVGLHPARLGLDLITTLAAVAPYLLIGAAISWGYYLMKVRSIPARRLVRSE